MRTGTRCVCVVVWMMAATWASAATYYISPTGSNTFGDGTRENPWFEFENVFGLTTVQSGDEIVWLDGVYHYGDDKQSVYGRYFDPNNPLIVRADNPGGAILEAAGDPVGGNSNSEGFAVLSSRGVVVDGLEVRHSGDNAVHIGTYASYVWVRNCKIHDAGSDGDSIKINGSDHIYIENCEVYDPGQRTGSMAWTWQENIDFMSSTDSAVRNCMLYHTARGGDAMLYAKGDSHRTVFEGNVLRDQYSGAWFPPITLGGTFHSEPSQMVDGGVMGDDGPPPVPDMNDYSGYDMVFRNNLVIRATHGSVAFTACSNGWVVNNVFYDCAGGGVWFLAQENAVRTSRDCHVNNNVFYDPDGDMEGLFRRGLTANGLQMVVYNFSHSNNLFYNAGNPIPSTGFEDANAEIGAVFADPQFVSPGAGGGDVLTIAANYRIPATSPTIDAGADMSSAPYPGVAADFDGNTRPAGLAYDIGMFEYVPALIASDPNTDGTLAKTANNVITLTFDAAIALPIGDPLVIEPIAGGADVGDQFACSVEPDGVTLKAVETGEVLTNQTWYRVTPADALAVQPFAVDLCTLIGDANGDGQVMALDLGGIWAHNGEVTDARYDINGDGQVMALDLGAAWGHNGQATPAKP